jgi:endonuclease/exonuclease/phosphatase family metal-dependent hydrolase
MVTTIAHRSASSAALRLAVTACALAIALAGCGRPAARSAAPSPGGATFTLMQMNLCLSGLADCYSRVAYPAAVDEAAALIRAAHPDAVTVSEACRGDVARIARRTGYHLRFSTVIYGGRPFGCVRPGGRGFFGDAVLTKAAIVTSAGDRFAAQAGMEERRWLCVTTTGGIDVCTAHMNTRSPAEVVGNDGQCADLTAILAHRATARAVVFGGDVNRVPSCAPAGFWTRTDASAGQGAGLQQVYGSGALHSPSARVVPFTHSDHDVLVVTSNLLR